MVESKKGGSEGCCFDARCADERSDAQPPRSSTENIKNKVVVLTGREELPNEMCEDLFRPIRSRCCWKTDKSEVIGELILAGRAMRIKVRDDSRHRNDLPGSPKTSRMCYRNLLLSESTLATCRSASASLPRSSPQSSPSGRGGRVSAR